MHHKYTVKIDADLQNEEILLRASLVTGEKREKIKRLRRAADAQRALVGDVLSRYALCTNYNLRNHELFFSSNEHGKPLVQTRPDIHFNLSHAGRYVACCVGDDPWARRGGDKTD